MRRMAVLLGLVLLGTAAPVGAQHSHDPAPVQNEHAALFDPVADHHATHVSAQSGPWTDPTVWAGGEVPSDGARVIISHEHEVTLSVENSVFHKTIRVDGKLSFATDVDTKLRVDTLVVGVMGHLEIGTAASPVQSGVNARIIIADDGVVDTSWDPRELSRGLIAHGRTTIHGEVKTSHADLAEAVVRRGRELVLNEAPVNWHVGDILILPGTHQRRDFDEMLQITAVNGNRVEVVGLAD